MNISSSSNYYHFNSTGAESGFDMSSVLYIFTVVFSAPINSYVMWLIVSGTGSGLSAEFFILNLCVCEIFICVEFFLAFLAYAYSILWDAFFFLDGLGLMGRPLFQCLISVEHYLAVVHPVIFLKLKPLRYRVICCVFVWISCVCGGLICLISYLYNGILVASWLFLLQFLLFFSIQIFCCVSVLRALKQSGPGERRRDREEENHMKRRAFQLIFVTTVTMVIIYFPFVISVILYNLTQQDTSMSMIFIFISLGGLVQPVLYLHRSGKHCCCSS